MEGGQIQGPGLAYLPALLSSCMHPTCYCQDGGSFFVIKSVEPMVQELKKNGNLYRGYPNPNPFEK